MRIRRSAPSADVDPDDVPRRVRDPEGAVRRQDGADQQHHGRRLPRRRTARGNATDRACSTWPPTRSASIRPRSAGATSCSRKLPAHHDHGRQLRLPRVRQGARRRALGVGLRRPARRASRPPRPATQADRHRRVVIRRGHRTGRAARRMGRMRGQRRRLCDRVRRHECPRPRALDRTAMLASDVLGIPMDKITLVNSDTTRPRRCPRSARGRCRPPAARSTSPRKACSSGPRRSPPTC